MSDYRYGWDSSNKKKVYLGKYPSVNPSGYYGNNEAGNKQEFNPNTAGVKREFVGSQSQEYTFKDVLHGTHTITAESYAEAVRVAESMGYKESDYQPRRKRGKRGKRGR